MRRVLVFLAIAACGGKIAGEGGSSSSSSSGVPIATVTATTPVPTTPAPPPPPPSRGTNGLVACGDGACDARGDEVCCATTKGESCESRGSECNGSAIACDDTSDCGPKQPVCCMRPLQNGLRMSAYCTDTCILNSISFQACATDKECEQGTCQEHVCQGRAYRYCGAALEGYCEK